MNNGYVKLHRKLINWEWYQDANTFRLFLHLLMKANHKNGNWKGNKINRGQLITGRKTLSSELSISERSIRTALDRLIKTKEVTTKTTNRYTLVTLINYDSYQSEQQQATNQLPSIDQLLTTNKNVKNVKNVKRVVDEVSNFNAKWLEFVEHRKGMKKTLTIQSANSLLNKLATFNENGVCVMTAIDEAISSGWSGVFEPKKINVHKLPTEIDFDSTGWEKQ